MKSILGNNELLSGVYKITNLLNNRFYIGSTRQFKARVYEHTNNLKNNAHCNTFFQADWNKCKDDNFLFEILEVTLLEARFEIEQKYLDLYYDDQKICYNLRKTTSINEYLLSSKNMAQTVEKRKATCIKKYGVEHFFKTPFMRNKLSLLPHRIRTEEELKRISASRKKHHLLKKEKENVINKIMRDLDFISYEEILTSINNYIEPIKTTKTYKTSTATREKQRNAKLGKKQSIEHALNAAKNRKGRPLPKRTTEQKQKMSKAQKEKNFKHSEKTKLVLSLYRRGQPLPGQSLRPVLQFDLDGIFIKEFICIMDAARELNIFNSNIVKCCKGRIKTYKGFIWKYKE